MQSVHTSPKRKRGEVALSEGVRDDNHPVPFPRGQLEKEILKRPRTTQTQTDEETDGVIAVRASEGFGSPSRRVTSQFEGLKLKSEEDVSRSKREMTPVTTIREGSPVRSSSRTTADESIPLTWQDHEITGHVVNDPDDDGEGVNGIGFKPTAAVAHARAERRRQQIQDYRSREMREARRLRIERRTQGRSSGSMTTPSPSASASAFEKEEYRPKVRFLVEEGRG